MVLKLWQGLCAHEKLSHLITTIADGTDFEHALIRINQIGSKGVHAPPAMHCISQCEWKVCIRYSQQKSSLLKRSSVVIKQKQQSRIEMLQVQPTHIEFAQLALVVTKQ